MLSINPSLPSDDIHTILRNTANKITNYTYVNGFNQYVGYGQLNTYNAVDSAENYISIIGNKLLCASNHYYIINLPAGATVTWTLSDANASKFNLVQNSPSTGQCTITKKSNAVFNSSTFTLTLTANIYQGSTLVKIKTKTLTCNNGFAGTYEQAAHSYYGVNYPAITQTQMTSATNYVYPGGIVYLRSDYFRGKYISYTGIAENFQHVVGQDVVKFSLPPFSTDPLYINVAASGCDEALQLTFYPMAYNSKGAYSAQFVGIGNQEFRVSLMSDSDDSPSWTVEAVNAMTGRQVLSANPDDLDYVLNTSGWSQGLYVVRVLAGGEVILTSKITKQ